jgi:hypothetical protein
MLLSGYRYMLTYRHALAQGVGVTAVRYIWDMFCESPSAGAHGSG